MTSELKFSCVLIFFILLNDISIAASKPHLIVTNDGPAVVGSNVTFFALLSGYKTEQQLNFIFDDGVQKSVSIITHRLNVSLSFAFPSDQYAERRYRMNVIVKSHFMVFKTEVAANYTDFDLKNSLIGEIQICQGNRSINEDVEEIAVGENFTATINLYDPNNYLKSAIIDYSWSFDMDPYLTSNNSFTYSFSDVGKKTIIVKPRATFPDSRSIAGFFTKELTAKVPVNHVNVSGNPFLKHGDFLKLNISCFGTPPFAYCSEILKDNMTVENFTCSQISIFTNCHMEINKFLTDGKYHLGIFIGNDVKEVKKIMEIVVYNVSIKPTLSTIVIPIVCSLLTLVIIAIGIAFYIQQRNQFVIEVADFDFQDESDSFAGERTFFEKIFDSFACRNCGRNQWSCANNQNESDPLLNDESSVPQV